MRTMIVSFSSYTIKSFINASINFIKSKQSYLYALYHASTYNVKLETI